MRWVLVVVLAIACGHPASPKPPARVGVHRAIATSSPEAQRHFDLGLAHAYAFNFDAAKLELEAALAADPACAMCMWGLAYAAGANINERDKRWPGALENARKAVALAKDPVERAFATALVTRYADPKTADDAGYAAAMRALATAHPDDTDAAILFVEATMLTVPIGAPYWPSGTTYDDHGDVVVQKPNPAMLDARSLLESVLARSPDHIGAIHFYIHLMEDSPDMALAIPYADKLASLAPDAGHLIHMASHLYLRVGRYADAEDANRKAIAADVEMVKRLPAGATYTKFAMHPKHFLWQTLLWQGERAEAKRLAAELAPHLHHMAMDVKQPLGLDAMVLAFTAARFSDWDDALALEIPTTPVGALATHYARGLALAAKGRLDEARQEVEFLGTATFDNAPAGYASRLRPVASIARSQLSAAVFVADKLPEQALESLRRAVQLEDVLDNPLEPELWIFSSRERLGALLLKLGRNQEAADAFRIDLTRHPESGWSLFGYATALEALHDPLAPAVRARFQRAWARSDFELRPELL